MIDVHRTSSDFEGIVEGDYNIWTKKWLWEPSSGLYHSKNVSFYIDEENDIYYLWFINNSAKHAFGAYNIQDHSVIFESPSGSHYTSGPPNTDMGEYAFHLGACALSYSSISRSHRTYILLWRFTGEMMEVWRAGAKIWERNLSADSPQAVESPRVATISLTGKYILIMLNYEYKLILYEGSYV